MRIFVKAFSSSWSYALGLLYNPSWRTDMRAHVTCCFWILLVLSFLRQVNASHPSIPASRMYASNQTSFGERSYPSFAGSLFKSRPFKEHPRHLKLKPLNFEARCKPIRFSQTLVSFHPLVGAPFVVCHSVGPAHSAGPAALGSCCAYLIAITCVVELCPLPVEHAQEKVKLA